MSNVEELIRQELHDLAGRPQPDAGAMLGRVRVARRRTNTVTIVAALALLLTVSATVIQLRPAPPTLLEFAAISGVPADATAEINSVRFLDADHGSALLTSCTNLPCTAWLATTDDGGKNWNGTQVPDLTVASVDDLRDGIEIINDHTFLISDTYSAQRRHTSDTGLTWHHPGPEPTVTIDQIPPGSLVTTSGGTGAQLEVLAITPEGVTARLTTPPEVILGPGMILPVITATDGSHWIRGSASGQPIQYTTRDGGQTWNSIPLPPGAAPANAIGPAGSELLTADGRHVYLVDSAHDKVWRTTDDGRNWQELSAPIPTNSDIDLAGWADTDGSLYLFDYGSDKIYNVGVDGDRLRPTARNPLPLGGREWDIATNSHSADGRTWTQFPFSIR